MNPLLLILIITLGAAVLFFAVLLAVYIITFYSPNRSQNNVYGIPDDEQCNKIKSDLYKKIDDLLAQPFEIVTVTSFDRLKLYGRYYHYKDGAPLDIAFHGYRGNYARDMCGSAAISKAAGHNFLLVDQRAHGNSKGHTISLGINERYDCISWVNYAIKRFGDNVKIMLCGVSMGATTVLMASGLNLPDNVYGIFADSPYSSPKSIIKKVCRDLKCLPAVFYPLIKLAARIYGGFSIEGVTAENAVKKTDVPIAIVHGCKDKFVPSEMSEEIYKANPYTIERYTFPNAGHGLSYFSDTERYVKIVKEFTDKYCK